MPRIFLSPPDVGSLERQLLLEAFDSNWIAPVGPALNAFEREVCEKVGVRYAVALSSGTAALHLALVTLGVGPGDDVITSTLTFVATANAIAYTGARPVFVDCDPATWTIDPDLLAEALATLKQQGRRVRAVVPVDIYGQCADYDRLVPLCRDHDIPVVEDAAEALGAFHGFRAAGSLGDMAILSFNGNKIITTSGGGMFLSNDSGWAARVRYLATQARDEAPHYQHSAIGYNYRLSNLLAAIGVGQLRSLDSKVKARRDTCAFYSKSFSNVPGIAVMPEASYGRSTRWLTCITIDPQAFGATTKDVREHLDSASIEARPVWKPMHLQPIFESALTFGGGAAASLFQHGLCLPSGSHLSPSDRERVVEAVISTPRTR